MYHRVFARVWSMSMTSCFFAWQPVRCFPALVIPLRQRADSIQINEAAAFFSHGWNRSEYSLKEWRAYTCSWCALPQRVNFLTSRLKRYHGETTRCDGSACVFFLMLVEVVENHLLATTIARAVDARMQTQASRFGLSCGLTLHWSETDSN